MKVYVVIGDGDVCGVFVNKEDAIERKKSCDHGAELRGSWASYRIVESEVKGAE